MHAGIWKRLYREKSSRDSGTLVQLRNLINRKTVPKDPKNQVHASEDFLKVMCIAHVIAAAMAVLEVDSLASPFQIMLSSYPLEKNRSC